MRNFYIAVMSTSLNHLSL